MPVPKGTLEAMRQMIATYPSTAGGTAALVDWALDTKARLDALRVTGAPWRFVKINEADAKSLTPEELEQLVKLILKCTDLKQLTHIKQALWTQAQPIVARFKRNRYR